jgi:hypothetical protein
MALLAGRPAACAYCASAAAEVGSSAPITVPPWLAGSLTGHAVTINTASTMLLTLAAGSIPCVATGLPGLADLDGMVIRLPARICLVRQPAEVSQGTVACRTASVSASVRRCVTCWYSGSATIRLNVSRLG